MSIKRGPPPPKKRQQDILSTDNSKQPVMTLQQIMASYQNVERIPSSILPTILQTAFPSSKIVHTYNDDHYVVMASIRDMVNVPHGRWEFNRPADRPRCEEMALSIVRAKKPLSTMIYLTFDNQKQIFEIYDGNNRVTTFDIISERNTQVNLVSSNEFEKDLSWLFDFKITLDIHFNATRGEMMDNFEKLNKCIPVSELYHRDVANDKRICVEKEVAFWTKEYES
jgi:hypothetical protein